MGRFMPWKSLIKVFLFVVFGILLVIYANLWMQCFRAEMSMVGMWLISIVMVLWLMMPLRYFSALQRPFSLFAYIKYFIADFGLVVAGLGKLFGIWLKVLLNLLRLQPFHDSSSRSKKSKKSSS